MLTHLRIENLALIDSLELEFGEGLCLLTGETGAGKSILVEAVGLVAGDRAESEMVRTGATEATVEATFQTGRTTQEANGLLENWGMKADGDVVIRRRVQRAGRNAITVNGASVTLAQLRDLGAMLVQIHGQHQSQSLLDEESHRAILDAFPSVAPHAKATADAHASLSEALARLRSLQRSRAERDQRLDTLRFQREEIDRVGPKHDEEEEILLQKARLQNAGRIAEDASAVASLLRDGEEAAAVRVIEAVKHLESLAEVDPSWMPFVRDLRESAGVIGAVASEAERASSTTTFDPEALEGLLSRLADMDRLKRKYGPTLAEVLSHREALEVEYRHLSGEGADPEVAALAVSGAYDTYLFAVKDLSGARLEAARTLGKEVESELRPLALEKARFLVELPPFPVTNPEQARPEGLEDVRFLFSANPGEPLKPLAKVASGGELSRTLMALLTACRSQTGPHTLIFDEVDSGVGGKPAERVGRRLRDLAAKNQVLCITHLPQIAAFAHHHYRVHKESHGQRTLIRAEALSEEERRTELARMLAGEHIADTARRHAEELLRSARA